MRLGNFVTNGLAYLGVSLPDEIVGRPLEVRDGLQVPDDNSTSRPCGEFSRARGLKERGLVIKWPKLTGVVAAIWADGVGLRLFVPNGPLLSPHENAHAAPQPDVADLAPAPVSVTRRKLDDAKGTRYAKRGPFGLHTSAGFRSLRLLLNAPTLLFFNRSIRL